MEKGAGRLGCPAMVLTLQENLGSPSGLIQAVRVGVSVISFAAIFAISYNIWRPKNTDIALVFIWLT